MDNFLEKNMDNITFKDDLNNRKKFAKFIENLIINSKLGTNKRFEFHRFCN